jgi:hypothetical protein
MDNKNYFTKGSAGRFRSDILNGIDDLENTLVDLEAFITEVKLENIDSDTDVMRLQDMRDKLYTLELETTNIISDLQ